MSCTVTLTKEIIAKAEAIKAKQLNNCLGKATWLSDKKFPSTNVELLEKEFKKNVLKED
jgi:hypothetical protein